MISIKCNSDSWFIYEAYSIGRGWFFRLLGGGLRKVYVDEKGENVYVYKVWNCDVEKLRYLVATI